MYCLLERDWSIGSKILNLNAEFAAFDKAHATSFGFQIGLIRDVKRIDTWIMLSLVFIHLTLGCELYAATYGSRHDYGSRYDIGDWDTPFPYSHTDSSGQKREDDVRAFLLREDGGWL